MEDSFVASSEGSHQEKHNDRRIYKGVKSLYESKKCYSEQQVVITNLGSEWIRQDCEHQNPWVKKQDDLRETHSGPLHWKASY